jgi:hypothetical protein
MEFTMTKLKNTAEEYDDCVGVKSQSQKSTLADLLGIDEDVPTDPVMKSWVGMPSFRNEADGPWKTVYVHFRNEDDYKEFQKLIGQNLTEKTKAIWHPKLDNPKNSLCRWVEEE